MAANNIKQGFTLVELMVAMTLTVILIGGVASVYITLKQTSTQVNQLENAQEILRNAHQVFYRSTLRTNGITASATSVTFNQAANSLACDGTSPDIDFTELYYLENTNLICRITALNQQDIVLMTNLTGITFSLSTDTTIGPTILSVIIAPEGLPENFPLFTINGQDLPGMQLDFALKTLIMNWAT